MRGLRMGRKNGRRRCVQGGRDGGDLPRSSGATARGSLDMEGGIVAEPATTKVTLLAALAVIQGPLAAQYSLILAAGLIGGFVGLSLRDKPLPGWWRPVAHVMAGSALALVVTPMGAAIALHVAPKTWELELDLVLPVVALSVAIWWHPAVSKWFPGVIGKKAGIPEETPKGRRK